MSSSIIPNDSTNDLYILLTLAALFISYFWPQLIDSLRGRLELAGMHWSQLGWSKDTLTDAELDLDELEAEADELSEEETTRRPIGTGKTRQSNELFPGLYNAGGNACFLNAAVQSMASIEALVPYLIAVVNLARAQGSQAPVSTALLSLVLELNKPSTSRHVLRPNGLALALYNSSDSRKSIMNSEQQDAHEFYVMLAEAVGDELTKLERGDREASEAAQFGLQTLSSRASSTDVSHVKDPFDSLMARRVSCVSCQYTENVVHYHEEHLTLNVPFTRKCNLSEMLDDYVKLDLIDERVCRKCSLLATIDRLKAEVDAPVVNTGKRALLTLKRKKRDLATLREVLQSGEYERDLGEVKLDRAERPATKQAMFARPPAVLAVHLVRSSAYGRGGAVKNGCRVTPPAELDLSPYTTSSHLPIRPSTSMSTSSSTPLAHRYRLTSVVEHYGSHSYGHYVAYTRRKGQWYRISDETVEHADLEDALYANPFLLFYERIEAAPRKAIEGVKARVVQRKVAKPSCTSDTSAKT